MPRTKEFCCNCEMLVVIAAAVLVAVQAQKAKLTLLQNWDNVHKKEIGPVPHTVQTLK